MQGLKEQKQIIIQDSECAYINTFYAVAIVEF